MCTFYTEKEKKCGEGHLRLGKSLLECPFCVIIVSCAWHACVTALLYSTEGRGDEAERVNAKCNDTAHLPTHGLFPSC